MATCTEVYHLAFISAVSVYKGHGMLDPMHLLHGSWIAIALLGALLLSAGCNDPPQSTTEEWEPPVCQDSVKCCTKEELTCSGDPDRALVCTCHRAWTCDDRWAPGKCTQEADTPDGGAGWSCTQDEEFERCERSGGSPPEGRNGWSCEVEGAKVVCLRPAVTPDGTTSWDCTYHDQLKECVRRVWGGLTGPFPPPMTGSSGCKQSDNPPDILIVLDRSGSMNGTPSKWSQASNAVNTLVSTFEGEIRFGLMLFPGGSSCGGGTVTVPIGDSTSSAIAAMLSSVVPMGDTPIAGSLQNALTSLKGIDPGKEKHVLLVTDGGETCGGDPVYWVKALLGAKVETYVVGFGSGVDGALLNSLALAGGTALSGVTKYFQVQDQAQLIQTLESVGSQVCK